MVKKEGRVGHSSRESLAAFNDSRPIFSGREVGMRRAGYRLELRSKFPWSDRTKQRPAPPISAVRSDSCEARFETGAADGSAVRPAPRPSSIVPLDTPRRCVGYSTLIVRLRRGARRPGRAWLRRARNQADRQIVPRPTKAHSYHPARSSPRTASRVDPSCRAGDEGPWGPFRR